jgi:hypothetical protein
MQCPHCRTIIHPKFSTTDVGGYPVGEDAGLWKVDHEICPACSRVALVIRLMKGNDTILNFMAYPIGAARPVAPEVEPAYSLDCSEACNVLPHSAKASAALSRRILQALLRDKSRTKSKDLYDQIEEVLQSGKLPSHIEEELHAVRHIGNFAAHTIKSTNTGEIIEVEPGEAEWNLDVLESLFDFYFVQPAISAKRKAALNVKLKEAGKPEIP